ncbi:hypothetical protein CC86DRAFT_325809 [Ophiobolus disseminans]|uniref:DUF7053 domain-containing protein n=1 Tax=Ophiobolus disseminans TaxID=1469910 RepID=A0A6A6ZV03_9PLEO|nr:hypothetical protein CC86DRAFT_325809 [Ophiobolus disseminans]
MFSFNSTATLHHVTPLPPSTTFAQALEALHNHDLLIRLDPEFAHYETLPLDPSAPSTKRYKVTDHMHALPKGLWDSTVSFEAEMTNTEDGILWIVKAPLGLVQRTTWRCLRTDGLGEEDKKGQAEWSLVEDVEIRANRLLVGTVRGKCEENWRGSHGRFCEFLVKEGEGEKK